MSKGVKGWCRLVPEEALLLRSRIGHRGFIERSSGGEV